MFSTTSRSRSGLTSLRHRLNRREWAATAGMGGVVVALHIIGWATLFALVVPRHLHAGSTALGAGLGLTAYTLGLRHAFDADHISAIDNTTRKLMNDGRRPLSVGFYFSLGHSTVVFVLTAVLAAGVTAIAGPVVDRSSSLHKYTQIIGTLISGGFLYLIAGINITVLLGIIRVFRAMRAGRLDERELERQLDNRGFMNRIFRGLTKSLTAPWQMYPVGILFGLGFDTATEVALLVLAGTSAAAGLPWFAILCMPVLFAAGMSLFDTLDGCFMNFAYGWAFSNPARKVFYNLTITSLSVAVASIIGTIEILALMADRFEWSGAVWDWLVRADLNMIGFGIVGLFVFAWALAVFIWKFGRLDKVLLISDSVETDAAAEASERT